MSTAASSWATDPTYLAPDHYFAIIIGFGLPRPRRSPIRCADANRGRLRQCCWMHIREIWPRTSERGFGRHFGQHLGHVGLRLLPWGLIVLVWELITLTGIVGAGLVPSPFQVWSAFWKELSTEHLLLDVYMSSQRVILG